LYILYNVGFYLGSRPLSLPSVDNAVSGFGCTTMESNAGDAGASVKKDVDSSVPIEEKRTATVEDVEDVGDFPDPDEDDLDDLDGEFRRDQCDASCRS
jgi:hypothetical protein